MTLRQENNTLSMLCMALLYVSMNLGTVVAALSPDPLARGMHWAAYHYAGILIMALVLVPVLPAEAANLSAPKGIRGLVRPLPLCVLASGFLALLASPLDPAAASLPLPDWIPASSLGLFWPLALVVFFSVEPLRLQGIGLGICMAVGDLVWIAFQPFISLVKPGLPLTEQAVLIHHFQGVAQGGLALCLALGFSRHIVGGKGFSRCARDAGACPDRAAAKRGFPLVGLLFAAGLTFLTLYGLGLGIAFPKVTPQHLRNGDSHLVLLVAAPLAGLLLDRGGRGLLLVGALLALTACGTPLACFAVPGVEPELLHGLLGIGRQTCFLTLYVLLARILRGSPLFPLFGSLVHTLYLAQPLGPLLGRACQGLPGGVATAALILLLLFLALLCVLGLRLRARPDIVAPARPGDAEAADLIPVGPVEEPARNGPGLLPPGPAVPAPDREKLAAFADFFALTKREAEILDGLIRNMDIATVSQTLGIRERTVRFHLTGLLKKTALPSRQRLLHFYAAWKSDTSEESAGQ